MKNNLPPPKDRAPFLIFAPTGKNSAAISQEQCACQSARRGLLGKGMQLAGRLIQVVSGVEKR